MFRPVCPQEGKIHAGRLQRGNVTKQEEEREELRETTELGRDGALLGGGGGLPGQLSRGSRWEEAAVY